MGRFHDSKGVPIYPGDLLRTPHFRDRRGRLHYLYHTVVETDDRLEMVPTSHLEPSKRDGGGRCWLSREMAGATRVISGYGPGDFLSYEDRPRMKPGPVAPTEAP